MASETGIPQSVIAAQAQAESNFDATAVSPTGAEGWLQFEPATYDTYAAQAGVQPGSEFDPASEAKVYPIFMKSLLDQEHGNLRDALAAYNAGPGNLSAGYGYADSILSAAGAPNNLTVASTAGIHIPGTGINIPTPGSLSVSGIMNDAISTVLNAMGLGSIKDMLERAGLIILGFVLVIVGINILSKGSGSKSSSSFANDSGSESTNEKTSEKPSEYEGRRRKGVASAAKSEATEAAEAAVVA